MHVRVGTKGCGNSMLILGAFKSTTYLGNWHPSEGVQGGYWGGLLSPEEGRWNDHTVGQHESRS